MRRRTPGVVAVAETQRRLLAHLDELDHARALEVLDPLVTDERRAKFHAVFGSRVDSVTVVMDAPHDPHNGAAVMRSCDAFGVQTLHVIERFEPFVAATSVARGSDRWVDAVTYGTTREAVTSLRAKGYSLVATHPEGKLEPADLATWPRAALVLGNERDGIGDELREACDAAVRIPMRGFAESLNVSVTAAILLQQLTRGRPGDLPPEKYRALYVRALVLTLPRAYDILAASGVAVPE